ncbi:MAG: protein kinase [Gemmatimonadales bacterium]|nr:protein kinase [Gemmatimonadales bacterium]
MTTPRKRLLARAKPESFGSGGTTPATGWELPIGRARLMALALIALWGFELFVGYIVFKISPEFITSRSHVGLPNSFWTVPPSILLLVLFGIRKIPWQVKLGLTIVYVFTITIIIAAGEVSSAWWTDGRRIDGLPWVSMWILLVPIVIAIPWRRQIGRALFLSAIPPLVLYSGTKWFDIPDAPLGAYLDFTVPSIIAAALAVILANMMYRLRRQAQEAQRLGSYVLQEQIGSGGMGEVWRASHNMLVRPAAIKLIRPERLKQAMGTAEASVVDRFQLEAQATASLRSPHTVELYDFGVAEDGTFHYVMELLEGLDLERLVKRFGPLQSDRVIFLLEQACDSLADAHANGLIHRDIKPANIYACRLGQRTDFVKVLDFGLVKWTDTGGESLALTTEQAVLGTPAFMAPELVTGDPSDHRVDLYSLGCVGYWLLTGQLVFQADGSLAMAVAHVNKEPVPPSERSELEIPAELEAIIMGCLAKDPSGRPQTAAELGARLASCDSGDWTNEIAREWWDTHLPADVSHWHAGNE